ncbi:ABC-type glycerol-3-phosphate transport system substrate-binding protein [Crossiella equi]|uniref:ABC-type glycerol-3-phosphate transport system substrate-binding protein n=1 Tax=Crossiella equi TaxID=130796 RepID=A0ABS5AR91_9PSEU|nr:extracellular solute-binding protein [Crossiella equi]MBP2479066.1 ABC-type glycerol-3-phosphate transport system substrate-binding protein [Crossiella equi]
MVRRTSIRLLCAALALTAAGCGLSDPAVTTGAVTSGQVTGAITFQTLQLSPTFDGYLRGIIAEFERRHPGTRVTWQDIPSGSAARKTNADAVARSLPDVLDLDTGTLAPLARKGLVVDMSSAARELRAGFLDSAWRSLTYGGASAAALPWYLNTPVLLKNSALLAEAGLAEAPDPTTYPELVEASAKIAKATGRAGFQPTQDGFPNYLLSLGVPLVDAAGTKAVVRTPEAVSFVDSLAALQKSGGIPVDAVAAQQRNEIETFQEGRTAYLETGGSRLRIIQQNAPSTYARLTLGTPLGATGRGTWVVAHGIAVPRTSKNLPTAVAFAKFLTSADNQLALAKGSSTFPSTTASLADPFFTAQGTDLVSRARSIAATSLKSGTTTTRPPAADAEFAAALWSAVQPAILGEIPAEQALANAENKLTSILTGRQ